VPTLERLRQPDACGADRPLVLLAGNDVLAAMTEWYRWERLFELAHIAIAHRPGYPIDPEHLQPELAKVFRRRLRQDPEQLLAAPAGSIVTFAMTPLDISATRIRSLLSEGSSPRYLLPESVLAHIHEHRFYTEN
jgi:nicotinate-nucleotide adenylyltransferase